MDQDSPEIEDFVNQNRPGGGTTAHHSIISHPDDENRVDSGLNRTKTAAHFTKKSKIS